MAKATECREWYYRVGEARGVAALGRVDYYV